jgi:outer membrane protein assembly factor BamD
VAGPGGDRAQRRARACIALHASALLLLSSACQSTPEAAPEIRPAEDLYAEGIATLAGRRILGIPWTDHAKAIELFQSVVDNYPYSELSTLASLKIGDAYFDQEKWDEALSYYRDFAELHPAHEQVPYSIYRSALCHERKSLSHLRDQQETRDAIGFLDKLLLHHASSPYAGEARELWTKLRKRLAKQQLAIGDFYHRREDYESAVGRYRIVLNEYPGLGYDPEALYRLGDSYWLMNRRSEAEQIFQAILQNYRDSDEATLAAQRIRELP